MSLVEKIWGTEDLIANFENKYCGKRMTLTKDRCCSLHFHMKKDESFYVESGVMVLEYKTPDGQSHLLKMGSGDRFDIPAGMPHRFYGIDDTVFFEFSTFDSPTDSIRITPSQVGSPADLLRLMIDSGCL